ncbi:hypothetical protein EDF42_0187 [Curtobacterium sp. PhB172]|nr:hypothetical protein EDF42_0187 [Curtobacterium sp. PhB172]
MRRRAGPDGSIPEPTPALRHSGTPALRHSGTPALRHSGTPALRHSGTPALRHSGTPALRHSGTPALRHSGTPALRHSGTPGLRDSGTPGLRDSGTPGLRDSGTPGLRDFGTSILPRQPEGERRRRAPPSRAGRTPRRAQVANRSQGKSQLLMTWTTPSGSAIGLPERDPRRGTPCRLSKLRRVQSPARGAPAREWATSYRAEPSRTMKGPHSRRRMATTPPGPVPPHLTARL